MYPNTDFYASLYQSYVGHRGSASILLFRITITKIANEQRLLEIQRPLLTAAYLCSSRQPAYAPEFGLCSGFFVSRIWFEVSIDL